MLACMNRLTAEAPVLVRADGPVARVTINRPEKRNVLGKEAFYPATWHRR
jgi:enoyl-CoA hydratase/carnithine racemase